MGIGEATQPVLRKGAQLGDLVCVTGELGRTQAALHLFAAGSLKRANTLFCFSPRIAWGCKLAGLATSMIDISDGLAHSLHLLAHESKVGCSIKEAGFPVIFDLHEVLAPTERSEALLFGGEDYELLFTLPERLISAIDKEVCYSVIGKVTKGGVLLDGSKLPDRGYEH
ncbi:TPA: hypothetical protein DIT45_03890 [Candidatus Acetothermia bacterium]|nr:hypothetical protein [Candidatus Acetothermia bacterium]